MAKYALSTLTLPRYYLVEEPKEAYTTTRHVFITVTAILGSIVTLKLIHSYLSTKTAMSSSGKKKTLPLLAFCTFWTHWFSYVIHCLHYVDNIHRPAAYKEPKFMYQAYVWDTMEWTFWGNFLVTFPGLWGMSHLLNAFVHQDSTEMRKGCGWLWVYFVGSMMTTGHYLIALPSDYEMFVNFTVAGEGVFTVLLAALLFMCWARQTEWSKQNFSSDKQRLISSPEDDKSMKTGYGDKKMSPNVRSRTPVKKVFV